MTRRRQPMTPFPDDLDALSRRLGIPIVLTDFQLTRRQRIHSVHWPDSRASYSDTSLAMCLDMATTDQVQRIAIAGYSPDGQLVACYADLSPIPELDPPQE